MAPRLVESIYEKTDGLKVQAVDLFLLHGGLPLHFTSVFHFGGRPLRFPRPIAIRC
jgi:hypothetical protein